MEGKVRADVRHRARVLAARAGVQLRRSAYKAPGDLRRFLHLRRGQHPGRDAEN